MTEKRLRKLVGLIYDSMKKQEYDLRCDMMTVKSPSKSNNSENILIPFDELKSEKIFSFINKLLTIDNSNLRIIISETDIQLYVDLTEYIRSKSVRQSSMYSGGMAEESYSYCNAIICKNTVRLEKYGKGAVEMLDTTMYDRVYELCNSKLVEQAEIKISSIIDETIVEAGIARGSNINDLLEDIGVKV